MRKRRERAREGERETEARQQRSSSLQRGESWRQREGTGERCMLCWGQLVYKIYFFLIPLKNVCDFFSQSYAQVKRLTSHFLNKSQYL